jgi:isoaspartyl peptidase/L-asparaginase-like protein (Ntn-hydrolase superfamily)
MYRMILAGSEGGPGLAAAETVLLAGGRALDAVVAGIRPVEADPAIRSVGLGGAPNLLGRMQCDASIMEGTGRLSGSVAAVGNCLHVISLARQVMERLPHVLLVGAGAERFARECGLADPEPLSPEAIVDHGSWLERQGLEARQLDEPTPLAGHVWPGARPDIAKGTTILLVRDGDGELAGGVSTSGWAYKYPGRLGDSPIIGAGLYVDSRFGAAACTHTGEMTIRAGTARLAVALLQQGYGVDEACREALLDLEGLSGGFLGPVFLHLMDHRGRTAVGASCLEGAVARYYAGPPGEVAELRPLLVTH